MVWDDAARTLTIGPRKGAFPGMTAQRILHVVIAAPGKNAGIGTGTADIRTVNYAGKSVTVKF